MKRTNCFIIALIAAAGIGICSAAEYTLTTGAHAGSEFTDLSGEVVFKVPAGETTISALNVNGATAVRFVGTSGAKLTLQNCSFVNCGWMPDMVSAAGQNEFDESDDKALDSAVVLFKDVKPVVTGTSFVGCRMRSNRTFGGPIVLVKGNAAGASFTGCTWKANDVVFAYKSVHEDIGNSHYDFAPSGSTRTGALVVEAGETDAIAVTDCTFGYNVMTAGWTAGLNARSGQVTVRGTTFWGNVASRTYSHHADLVVGYRAEVDLDDSVFAAFDELYLPTDDAKVRLGAGMKYGDPAFATRPDAIIAALDGNAAKCVLDAANFPLSTANETTTAAGNFYQRYKASFDRTSVDLTRGAGSLKTAATAWKPITDGDSGSSEVWARKTLGIRPEKIGYQLMSGQAAILNYGGEDGVMRSDGRDVQFFRHNFDPSWDDYDKTLATRRSDANTFSVAYPKDFKAAQSHEAGRPLLVSLHSRGGGAPRGGVYSTLGKELESDQTTSSPDTPYEAPDNAYVLSLDCMENHVYDFWWGAMPPATQNWVEKINIENVHNYYYTWTMWNVIKGQLFYGPTGPEGWTRDGALNPSEKGVPTISNLEYLHATQEKGTACEQRVLDTIEWVVRKYKIDRNRIYLAGNSMGGQGTLAIGLRHGEVFASIEGNVPATIWYPAVRMGFVDVNGAPVAKADYQKPDYDPPVCLDWSGSNDAWSRDHDVIYKGMNDFKFNFIGLWGPHGHIQNYSIGRKKNDLINTFDRFAVRRNEAYAAFSNATSNDPIPWPQKGYKNGDFDGEITVVDGHEVQGGELYIREGSVPAGQVNAYFRWKVLKDEADEFRMQLWIADGEELPTKQFVRPRSARADVTPRRLQNFVSASGKVNWTFGEHLSGVAEKDAVLDVWTIEQLPIAEGVPMTLSFTPAAMDAEVTRVDDGALVDIPTVIPTKAYTGEKLFADIPENASYTITGNDGVTHVGEVSQIKLTLASGKVWADGTDAPKNYVFSLTQAENAWTDEPSISADFWLKGRTPATLDVGSPRFGTAVASIPEDLFTSLAVGEYETVVTVPATADYTALSVKIAFTVYPAGTVDDVDYSFARVSTVRNDNLITFYDPTKTGEITFKTNTTVRLLVIGGGGGGGLRGGGGGAGGYISTNLTLEAGTYQVKVGAGGLGGADKSGVKAATKGEDSRFGEIVAQGGGAGASCLYDGQYKTAPGTAGASGGGGSIVGGGALPGYAATAVPPEAGNKGGDATGKPDDGHGGGGGGAGAAGGTDGRGGIGIPNTITGEEVYYAGGGGGGNEGTYAGNISGGKGGGGLGGAGYQNATAGTDGLGGGGGAGGGTSIRSNKGMPGGSGIVILRFYSPTANEPKAAVPEAKKLVYSGAAQIGVEPGEGYEVADNVGTDAGTYRATVTLKEGFIWEDQLKENSRIVVWTIEPDENAWVTPAAVSKPTWAVGESAGSVTLPVSKYAPETMSVTLDGEPWNGAALPTAVGVHTIVWTVPATANFRAAETSVTFEITASGELPRGEPENSNRAEIHDGDAIAFLGDSITNFGNTRNATGYVHIVTNVLKRARNVTVGIVPAGQNNDTSEGMFNRMQRDVVDKISKMSGTKWMTLMCGVNDSSNSGYFTADKYRTCVSNILDLAAANDLHAILMTPSSMNDNLNYGDNGFVNAPPKNFPVAAQASLQNRNWYEATVYLPILKEEAARRNIPLADVHATLWEMAAKDQTRFLPDDIHPNTYGNFCMARALLRAMGITDAEIDAAFEAIVAENDIVIEKYPTYDSATYDKSRICFVAPVPHDNSAGVAVFNPSVTTSGLDLSFVDYIDNGGAAYLDTDFELDGDDLVTARVRFNTTGGMSAVWCARNPKNDSGYSSTFSCWLNGAAWRYDHTDCVYGSNRSLGAVEAGVQYSLWAHAYTFKVDAKAQGAFYCLPWEGTTKGKLRLFAGYSATTAVTGLADMRLYGFKVTAADGTVKHDFVPAVNGGTAGLYDKETKTFYGSSNGTAFTAGPAVSDKPRFDFPIPAEGLVYTGLPQAGLVAKAGYVVSNAVKTAAGDYAATAYLLDPAASEWEDGTTAPKGFDWKIAKTENEWLVEPSVSFVGWTASMTEPTVTRGTPKFGTLEVTLDGAAWDGRLPKTAGAYALTMKVAATADWTALEKSFALVVSDPVSEGQVRFSGATTNWVGSELVLAWTNASDTSLFRLTKESEVKILLVGGGGSGALRKSGGAGGSAGGVIVTNVCSLAAGDYLVSVGAGGAAQTTAESGGIAGVRSTFLSTALSDVTDAPIVNLVAAGGAGGINTSVNDSGAGGKGAGGSGGAGSYQHGGAGGAAVANDITGEMKAYAGGGGGSGGVGGGGGGSVKIDEKTVTVGGAGGTLGGVGGNAVRGTGSGGGGAERSATSSGAGADGVVIVRIDINPCDHVWHSYPELPATCGKDGYTAYEQCELCGKIKDGGKVVLPATGEHTWGEDDRCEVCGIAKPHVHVWVEPPTLDPAPTCLTDGTNLWHCATEGCFDTSNEVVKALGHDAGVEVPAVAATCTNVGYTAGMRCGRCGDILSGCTEIPLQKHVYDAKGVCTVCGTQGPVPLHRSDIAFTGSPQVIENEHELVLVFTQDGSLSVTRKGVAELLVIGGGGGGGLSGDTYWACDGGHAGKVFESDEAEIAAGTWAVTVGAGGAGATTGGTAGGAGGDSSLTLGGTSYTAAGGAGGLFQPASNGIGGKGGSGAGGAADGRTGGAAIARDITGEMKAYAGGGGGMDRENAKTGNGGGVEINGVFTRVGGKAASWAPWSQKATDPVANTGSGGGAGCGKNAATSGADGVVIGRFALVEDTRAKNSWTTEPTISKTTWTIEETPGVFTWPVAAYGTVSATLNGEAWDGEELPTAIGSYTIIVSVPETDEYTGLSETITFSITDKPHVHEWTGPAVVEPTCTTDGTNTWTCSGCNLVSNEVVAALGHDWGEWTVTKPAAVGVKGEETRTCKRKDCGASETREIPALPDPGEKKSNLPEGYKLLKYISSASTGIDYWASGQIGPYLQIYNQDASPFVLGADDVVETKFLLNSKDTGACVFCVRGSSSGKFVLMRAGNSPYAARFDYGTVNNTVDQTKINLNNTDVHTAVASKSEITVDGTTVVPTESVYEPTSNALLLFCCDSSGNGQAAAGNKGTIKMYSFRVKDGSGNIRLDLVPMLRVADSKPGLYDAVSGQFFTNKSANGEFTYSESVTLIDRIAAETAFSGATDPSATGGDYVYKSGDDYVHVFSSTAAAKTFTVTADCTADVLIVGGGAGGSTGSGGSGGNAGEFVSELAVSLSSGSYTVAVGAGGAGNSNPGGSGGVSSLIGGTLSIEAEGGTGKSGVNAMAGDGGDGAGGAGGTHVAAVSGGNGGAAVASSILGWPEAFAGGGGGSGQYMTSGGAGGSVVIDETQVVIGGAGTKGTSGGNSGAVGTGSGGSGGAANYTNGGSGANGIVIIRVKGATPPPPAPEWDIPGVTGGINGIEGEGGKKYIEFEAIELTSDGLKINLAAAKIDADGEIFGLVCKTDLTSDDTIVINATLTAEKDATEGVFAVTADLSGYPQLFVVGIGTKTE